MSAAAQDVLSRARDLGIEIALHGDKIRYRPRKGMPADLLADLAAAKEGVRALLLGGLAAQETPSSGTDRTARSPACTDLASPVRPAEVCARQETRGAGTDKTARSHWPGLSSVLSVASSGIDEAFLVEIDGPDLGTSPGRACWACGSAAHWRLRNGSPWICPRCHPPELSSTQIQGSEGKSAGGSP
jgi:hypothetical protein